MHWIPYFVTVALTASVLPRAVASVVRGVSPTDRSKYTGSTFDCSDGKISSASVNDDFCDCADGSDEPGTAACASIGTDQTRPWFYCSNSGGVPRYLYPSKVGDGVCDCCDGSDEWQHGGCSDACEEEGRAHRARQEKQRESAKKGIEKRSQAIAAFKEKAESSEQRLETLRAGFQSLHLAEVSRKEDLDKAEALVQKLQEERAGREEPDKPEKAVEANGAASGAEGPAVSEYAKWMDKGEGTADTANSPPGDAEEGGISHKVIEHKVLDHVAVRSGDLVDFVTFSYGSEELRTGGGNGNQQEPFHLQSGETISSIYGGQGGLLDSITFRTSKGRESQRYGGSGGAKYSVSAAPGMQIVGLERTDGTAGQITAVLECDTVDRRSPEEVARDKAKDAHKIAREELEKTQADIRDLEGVSEADFSDTYAAYSLFPEKCALSNIDQYRFKICLFGEATQDPGHNTLGRWKGWDPKMPHVGLFDNGDRCFSGNVRELRVSVQCGESPEILQVREPSQCVYEATMTHPGACDPNVGQGAIDAHVIMPYEVHEEL